MTYHQNWTVCTLFHLRFTASVSGSKETTTHDSTGTFEPSSIFLRPSPWCLSARPRPWTQAAHRGPQFLGTLDLIGCSVVKVHEVRHPRQIRHRWRLSEPLRLPCQHRPIHMQTRLAQPPALPLVEGSKCSDHQMDPILFLFTVSRVVQGHSPWCSALSRGLSAD